VSRLTPVAALAALVALAACKKTDEGTYEVQRPVVGVTTDTVKTPTVDVKMQQETVTVPKVQVKKDSATVKVPKVKVKKP
jgi:outer membrane protein assembly factor BamE (lipoprotein component of BamABCDE complex)